MFTGYIILIMRPTDNLISSADKIIAGQGEAFQDWRDALELYQAAAKLESGEAFLNLLRCIRMINTVK